MEQSNQYLFRLVHLFGEGEHGTLSAPVTLVVRHIFAPPGCITSFTEMTLTANQELQSIDLEAQPTITLKPKEIRTFIVQFATEACDDSKCPNGKCVQNMDTCGYVCECNEGYVKSVGSTGPFCEAVGKLWKSQWKSAMEIWPLATAGYLFLVVFFGFGLRIQKLLALGFCYGQGDSSRRRPGRPTAVFCGG